MREKLIELLGKAHNATTDACFEKDLTYAEAREIEADVLIANGVTIQKWIPVAERLPEENDYYLCCVKSFCHPGRTYINILECDKGGFKEGHIYTDDVTHWMPLPEPPKEVE